MEPRYNNKPRHLHSVPGCNPDQINITDGIRQAVREGRMSPEIGDQCIESYQVARFGQLILHEVEPLELPDDIA